MKNDFSIRKAKYILPEVHPFLSTWTSRLLWTNEETTIK